MINIKLELIENDNLDVILASVIEQAQKSLVENKENLASFNKDFNDTLQKDLKIKAFPGYDIELGVTQYGKVQITISYNKGPKTKVQLSKEDSKNKNLTVDQKIQILLDTANNEDILKEATSSSNTKKGSQFPIPPRILCKRSHQNPFFGLPGDVRQGKGRLGEIYLSRCFRCCGPDWFMAHGVGARKRRSRGDGA